MRHALLLAGGRGTRFWPRSRRDRPKQFASFDGGKSLLRTTAERLEGVVPFARQWVVTHRDYAARVRRELPEVPAGHILAEPRAVNTAAAIALGAAHLEAADPDAVLLVQAADHWIGQPSRFRTLVAGAFREVEKRRGVVLVGFRPNRPATGYGYIEVGRRLRAASPGLRLFEVRGYREKPTAPTARRYLARGGFLWNGCMFFWHARTILDALVAHAPEIGRAAERIGKALRARRGAAAATAALYRDLAPRSIEHAVVEKLGDLVVLEGDCGWEDVGTWGALARLVAADPLGNVVVGPHLGLDTRRSLVLADSGLVVTLGVKDLIVVKDGDAVLILPRAREGELRRVVERLEREPRFAPFA